MFMANISMFEPDMIVWLDETGSDHRNSVRAYGYGLHGLTPVTHKLKVYVGKENISYCICVELRMHTFMRALSMGTCLNTLFVPPFYPS